MFRYQKNKLKEQTISPNDRLKQALQNFDQSYDTLIDYFAIIGFDNIGGQLRNLITDLRQGKGHGRTLQPSLLERFPTVDRQRSTVSVGAPACGDPTIYSL